MANLCQTPQDIPWRRKNEPCSVLSADRLGKTLSNGFLKLHDPVDLFLWNSGSYTKRQREVFNFFTLLGSSKKNSALSTKSVHNFVDELLLQSIQGPKKGFPIKMVNS